MRKTIRRTLGTVVGLGTLLMFGTGAPASAASVADDTAVRSYATTYEVTITNLTSGQALSPPVVATHNRYVRPFYPGWRAHPGVKEVAENGNNAPLLAALAASRNVADSKQAGDGPLVPEGRPGSAQFGDSVTVTIEAPARARHLSVVTMLICTNDGFTGASAARLPTWVGDSVTFGTRGYDAGTEINTEDFADLVPPCQSLIGESSGEPGTGTSNPALKENGVVRHHGGVTGGSDLLPGVHGWVDPVAKITITAVG